MNYQNARLSKAFKEFIAKKTKENLEKLAENQLNVDNERCDDLALKLMSLIDSDCNDLITKQEMELYIKHLLRYATPMRTFNQTSFDKGFRILDPDGLGYCKFD